jgi:hypothetical protein
VSPSFAAYLRVYEPLAAFDRDRQRYWRGYARDGRAVTTADGPEHQRAVVLAGLGSGWSRLPDLPDEGYLLESEDVLLVCPWDLRVRVAEAALGAREGVPPVIADAFVPPVLAAQARGVLEGWRHGETDGSSPRLHEQVSTWGIPLRWFAFVDLAERQMEVTPQRRSLVYRTPMSKARRRAHRAFNVLRRTMGDSAVTEAVEDGTRWLEEFHPRSVVELDYGGLVQLLTDEALKADDSPGLVSAGLAALGRGDTDAASECYEKLVSRWRAVQLLERRN